MRLTKIKSLIIFILAILITAGSWFIAITPLSLDASTTYRGLIFPYWSQTHATYDFGTGHFPAFPPRFSWITFVIDFLIWILILWITFLVISKIAKIIKK